MYPQTVSKTRKAVTISQHHANANAPFQVKWLLQDTVPCSNAVPGKGCLLGWAQACPGTKLRPSMWPQASG